MDLIRKTTSVCPECIKKIDANIVEENEKVYMIKKCSKHGKFKLLISSDAEYYKKLNDFYFGLNRINPKKRNKRQNYYNLFLTFRCNLDCPICYTCANDTPYREPTIPEIKNILKSTKNSKIGLWGGEPTIREDLSEIITIIKKSGNESALLTNGLKISNISYLNALKNAGLNIVHLSFDGFDNDVYKILRGKKLLKTKLKALKNLKKLDMPTVLEVTIARGINEKEMVKILEYGVRNRFIKAILFRSYSLLGNATLSNSYSLTPDEIISEVEKQTNRKINKKEIFEFQKFIYLFFDFLNIKKCFLDQYLLLIRNNGEYKTVGDVFDVSSIQDSLDKFNKIKNKHSRMADVYFPLSLLPMCFNIRMLPLIQPLLLLIQESLFNKRFTSSNLSDNFLILGFERICDRYVFDYQIAKECTVGEISTEEGMMENSAFCNIKREEIRRKNGLNKKNHQRLS